MVYFDLLWGIRSGNNNTNITTTSSNDEIKLKNLKKIECNNNGELKDRDELNISRILATQTSLNFEVQQNERNRLSSVIQTQIPWVEQTGISKILSKFCCTKSYRQQQIQQRQMAKRIFSTQFPPMKYN
ncbi:Hypothetical protein SRAE_X000016000 [Strongyloides ratti]|uniref:Uncharacterized protein n=1 Tax=Strongyloides ratti TaxID=34506 RepID=A0A090LLX3_STRRB|nr:Hypothetical protein SRAE_X000016000 [Strongyloides ratti]CEF70830.1 Hypothetical protein SRAE_X000016000 [Strongyloides ratti]